MSTPLSPAPFQSIPMTPDNMLAALGPQCARFEQLVLNLMRNLVGEAYTGGMYDLRRYPNGAIAMVYTGDGSQSQYSIMFGCNQQVLSIEAASLAANIIALSAVSQEAYEAGDETANEHFYNLYHALREVILSKPSFAMDSTSKDGIRDPNEADLEAFSELKQHPEWSGIAKLLD